MITRRTALSTFCLTPFLGSPLARAQTYPSKPLTWIVPWAAGGSADFATRLVGAELSKVLGQSVAIENVGGGGGLVGMNKAATAAGDGHTIYYGGTEMFVPAMTNPKITNDWSRQFKPVARLLTNPLILATRADAPYNNLDEFTAYAKKNPGRVTYASPGIATGQHMAGEMMRDKGKIALVHIPYRGGAQIVTDLLGGMIDCAFLIGSTAQPHLKSGKLKAIAIAESTRHPVFPAIPTFNESKLYGGLTMSPFGAVMVPFATPDAIVQKLSDALKTVMFNEGVRNKLGESAAQVKYLPYSDMGAFMKDEVAKYKRIVDFAKIKVSE
jgi:tripartite-type tricarboxylate transporter receptor subunit TctC